MGPDWFAVRVPTRRGEGSNPSGSTRTSPVKTTPYVYLYHTITGSRSIQFSSSILVFLIDYTYALKYTSSYEPVGCRQACPSPFRSMRRKLHPVNLPHVRSRQEHRGAVADPSWCGVRGIPGSSPSESAMYKDSMRRNLVVYRGQR